jgi:transposase
VKECPVSLLRPALTAEETAMQIIYRRCAGLDVHEKSVSACIRIVKGKQVETVEATFPTFTEDLEELRDWLVRNRIQRVAMESTGVYWRPVWNVLERKPAKLDLVLLNPQHVKALPGHKTDRVDAARIAELTQYGLVRASFVPPEEIRELRDLVRRRVHLAQDRSRVSSRIHRLLELQNIKLSSVLTKMTTKTARSILEGLATSQWIKPESLALLATHKRVRGKRDQLAKALRGCQLTDHFRFLLRELLDELDRLTAKMKLLEERIAGRMTPYAELIDRLCDIPGVDKLTAWTLIAEIGVDMSRFQTAGHLASWCGLCPGNAESAGKRHSGRTSKGHRYVRRGLLQAAWAAARITSKRTFFTTFFFRVSRKAGMKKAAVAVAHKILTLAYVMIRDGSRYREQGADYFDKVHPERTRNKLTHRLERLGFDVRLTPKILPETS